MLSKGSPEGVAISVQMPLLQGRIRGDHKILIFLYYIIMIIKSLSIEKLEE